MSWTRCGFFQAESVILSAYACAVGVSSFQETEIKEAGNSKRDAGNGKPATASEIPAAAYRRRHAGNSKRDTSCGILAAACRQQQARIRLRHAGDSRRHASCVTPATAGVMPATAYMWEEMVLSSSLRLAGVTAFECVRRGWPCPDGLAKKNASVFQNAQARPTHISIPTFSEHSGAGIAANGVNIQNARRNQKIKSLQKRNINVGERAHSMVGVLRLGKFIITLWAVDIEE